MPPFYELFSSEEFWGTLLLALVSGGGIVGTIITVMANRPTDSQNARNVAEADKLAAEAADAAVHILTDSVIKPLRDQVDSQERRIKELEVHQHKYMLLSEYTRSLFHWLNELCEITESDFLKTHPKPHLPDELREDIAPETI